ncbi:D-serine deaminase-like pyridoxal phosphate-dependent protein [Bradyrhizobium sp. USDA 4516]
MTNGSTAMDQAKALIGRVGSRYQLPTPALIVDVEALEHNIERMAQRAKKAGLALRPHSKTHKSAAIARLQIAAGAMGVCCAKLGEAEALANAGLRKLLVTSPVVGADTTDRAIALAGTDADLMLVVDHEQQVEALGSAAAKADRTLSVLIDVDVAMARTGVATPPAAIALAGKIASYPSLRLVGVQGYGGIWQHIVGEGERRKAVATGMDRLSAIVYELRELGYRVPLVTGGGTGTFAADAALKVLNDVQPGSYIFMDNQYRDALGQDDDGGFKQSLFVQGRVVSINAEKWVTVDAGLKAFATDGPVPRVADQRFANDGYFYYGDEHGGVMRPVGGNGIELGERIELTPPHCDPTVDRYSVYHFVRGDTLVDIVDIEAARRSQ